MHLVDGALLFSATDITEYVACGHLTQLELRATRGELARSRSEDSALEIVSRRGMQHERRYLEHLRSTGLTIAEIPWAGSDRAGLKAANDATVRAMRNGAQVIYQAALVRDQWRGYADFLVRVEVGSDLGAYSYEVYDAKLARRAKVAALLQMCTYSELLTQIQGIEPRHMHLILGDMRVEAFRLRDYSAYFRAVKKRFEQAVRASTPDLYPEPVEFCATCSWQADCEQRRRDDDHLSLVANIRRDQSRKLVKAGITTVAALAASPQNLRVSGMHGSTSERLRQQAALQVRQRERGAVEYELLAPSGPGHGLAALPTPSPGDLFFDMEGDPFAEEGGLEYLFGVVELVEGATRFQAFWAHDRAGEKAAFEQFVDFVMERLQRDPNLHVYHYAAYEATALRRLMGQHGTRESEVDQLLRGGVLVDLYQVVRQGLRVSQESYSIKKLEPLYMEKRDESIKDAVSSIIAYENWLETGDHAKLNEIEAYNEADCVSTWRLRDWLEARRDELATVSGASIPRPESPDATPSDDQLESQSRIAEIAERLTAGIPTELGSRNDGQQARWLLAQLLEWHRREAKPEWWAYFDRLAASDDDLVEDSEAIGNLAYEGVVREVGRSVVHRYHFDPTQEHKILLGSSPHDPSTRKAAGTVEHVDSRNGTLDLRRAKSSVAPHPRSVIPGTPINSTVLRQAIERCGEWVAEHGMSNPGPFQAAVSLLIRNPPAIAGEAAGTVLQRSGEDASEAARRIVMSLDGSCLPIQGPPGSGKTYTGALMILDLVKAGRRVGISANSHRAIGNLLDAACEAASREGLPIRAMQKAGERDRCASAIVQATDDNAAVESALACGSVDIVAGTPWLFAREQLHGALDVLFVDEAGQMSLANTVAIAGSARNLVLLGDPQQLPQPSTGSHPPGADQSALGHIIGTAPTISPELGILLDTTWRLHPSVCAFISELVYDDRLRSHDSCAIQLIGEGSLLGGTGLRYWPVSHWGNRSSSEEEVERVTELVTSLVGVNWTSRGGDTRPLEMEDILVVAPYNAQVSRILASLPDGARVGTVDKFQGQETPAVIFTTATSSAEDLPRALDFLFSLNRLNVAISRARGLGVLVSSPALLLVNCRTPDQMRLVNAFCRFIEIAKPVSRSGAQGGLETYTEDIADSASGRALPTA